MTKLKYARHLIEKGYTLPIISSGKITQIVKATPHDVQRLRDYWWSTYNIDIGQFTHIAKVQFEGARFAYDYPTVVLDLQGDDDDEA